MKRICAVLMACVLLLSGCSSMPSTSAAETTTEAVTTLPETEAPETTTEEPTTEPDLRKEIIIWAFGSEEELTRHLCADYLEKNPAMAERYIITVKPVNAEDLITRIQEATDTSFTEGLLPDVEEMPDLFFLYSDDYEMLSKAGFLSAVPEEDAKRIEEQTDVAAYAAACSENGLNAYPASLENTLLLYYDKSAVSETADLASVIAQCGEAGRCFYMGTETTMFPALIFLSCGLTYDANILPDGSVASVSCDYYTENGLQAAKLMQSVMSMDTFRGVYGSPILAFAYADDQAGAMIADSCQTQELQAHLADNYGVAALPAVLDGEVSIPMLSRGTFTLIGVSPKKDAEKLADCHKLAEYLVSDEAQVSRYEKSGALPVSSAVLADEKLAEDETASALMAQMPHVIRKVKRSSGYIEAMDRFTQQLLKGGAGMKTAKLQQLLDELSAYLMADGAAKAQASPSSSN